MGRVGRPPKPKIYTYTVSKRVTTKTGATHVRTYTKKTKSLEVASAAIQEQLKQGPIALTGKKAGKYRVGNRYYTSEETARKALRSKRLTLEDKISEKMFKENWSKSEFERYKQLKRDYKKTYKSFTKEQIKTRKLTKFANILAGAKNKSFNQFKDEIDTMVGDSLNKISARIRTDKNPYYKMERTLLTGRLKMIFNKLSIADLTTVNDLSYEYYNVADMPGVEEETAILNNKLNVMFKKYEN